jgi:pimeloyl-ACP methyl ester carboxylesterase
MKGEKRAAFFGKNYPMENSLSTQKVSFSSGNRRLPGFIFGLRPSGAARRGILFVHGQGSSQTGYEHRARSASTELNAICLTFDLSGHGDDAANLARYSVYEHLEDLVAAYDCLVSHRDIDSARIGVCGASYGGYLSALLTAHRAVRRLLLRAPSLASDVVFPARPTPTSQYAEVSEAFDSAVILAGYVGDVLIIESEKDEVIPRSHIATYLRACSRPQHQVIPEATHALTDPKWDELFVKAIVAWFRDL